MTEGTSADTRHARANRGFGLLVTVSVILHVVAIVGYGYAQSMKPSMGPVMNSVPVQLVALGKKRDPKLLPRIVQEEPAAPPPDTGVALETKDDPKNPPKPNDPKKKKEPKLSDRAQQLLDGKISDSKMDRALGKIEDREGDPDGDIHGTTTDTTNAATGYQRTMMSTLQTAYTLPETIPAAQRQFLNAQVLIFVERDGSILRYEFVERHPNEIFMAALESMLKQVKLPPPPAALAGSIKEVGVLIRFRPR